MDKYPGLDFVIAITIIAMILVSIGPIAIATYQKVYYSLLRMKFKPDRYQSVARYKRKRILVYDDYMHTFAVYQYYNKTWNKIASAFHEKSLENYFR